MFMIVSLFLLSASQNPNLIIQHASSNTNVQSGGYTVSAAPIQPTGTISAEHSRGEQLLHQHDPHTACHISHGHGQPHVVHK